MIDQKELKEILDQHKLWLASNGGIRANLSGADLRGADLICMQLDQYQVFVQPDFTRIGYERHENKMWLVWMPDDVSYMAPDARSFWEKYKNIVCAAIKSLMEVEK